MLIWGRAYRNRKWDADGLPVLDECSVSYSEAVTTSRPQP
jgi:hypothetical protein